MLIGVKKYKKYNYKKKKMFFLFIPIFVKKASFGSVYIKIFGIPIYKSSILNDDFYEKDCCSLNKNNINSKILSFKLKDNTNDIDILFRSLSVNLSDLKRLETKLLEKFPDLKNK